MVDSVREGDVVHVAQRDFDGGLIDPDTQHQMQVVRQQTES